MAEGELAALGLLGRGHPGGAALREENHTSENAVQEDHMDVGMTRARATLQALLVWRHLT